MHVLFRFFYMTWPNWSKTCWQFSKIFLKLSGPAEQEFYRNSRLPEQYHIFFPQNVRPQTGIRFQERSQGQHPQQHLASHQQHFQQPAMMVQPHPSVGAFVPNPSDLGIENINIISQG